MPKLARRKLFTSTAHVAAGGPLPYTTIDKSKERKRNVIFLALGIVFGFTLIKGEAASWFRMQEMFRFESIHMFGIMGVAVIIGMLSLEIIKKKKPRALIGEDIKLTGKPFQWSNLYGGIVFGLGWGTVGVCPGPIYALIGTGMMTAGVILLSAMLGTYTYGVLRHRLPH